MVQYLQLSHQNQFSVQILVSEIGDETFIIAAILAMKHPRAVVFVGALSALALMTVRLNAWLGAFCTELHLRQFLLQLVWLFRH